MKISKKELNQIIKEEAYRFLKIQSLKSKKATIQEALKENYSMEEEVDIEAAAEVAEEMPETPEAKEMADAMKELEDAAKAMSDEDKAELKAENEGIEENEGVEENEGIEENEGVEENEGIEENEGVEEGLMSMFKKDPKKGEEAIVLAKKAVEAEIDKGQMIEWKGLDKLTTGQVVRDLTDEEKADLKSRVQSFVDNVLTPKNKWDGLDVAKQDIRIVDLKGKPTLAAAYKDRKLAGVSGKFTESNEPISESEIRRIFKEEASRNEKIKELQIQANKIISEIEKIG